MARTYYFSNNLLDLNFQRVTYTPLSLGTVNRYDSTGETVQAGHSTGLLNYNVSLTRIGNGDSTNDSLRGTSGNDLFVWDFAVLSLGVSLPGLLTRFGLPGASQTAAIEVFDLDAGDDILNLTHLDQPVIIPLLGLLGQDPQPYVFAATAYGGDGNDILWSSTENDLLYGDANSDSLHGGGGDDTLYGGTGLDRLDGGIGDDLLIDMANGAVFHGGGGNDVIVMNVNDAALSLGASTADDAATTGDDYVHYSGAYASSSMSLGAGNDVFISSATSSAAADSVSGGTGLDVISTWDGDDRIAGDEGEDALWGGAGNDTIVGGAGTDYLYVGSGTDTVFGGGGHDYVYFGRQDSDGNQYYDLARAGETADGTSNTLVVMGVFDPSETDGDGFDDAEGVYELDGDLMDNAGGDDRVYVSQVSGNIYRLEIVGGGMTGADIEFDVRDVDQIILWDNAAVSGQNQQYFHWDAEAGAYVPGL